MMRCRAHRLHWKECVVSKSSVRILCSKMFATDIPRYGHLRSNIFIFPISFIMLNLDNDIMQATTGDISMKIIHLAGVAYGFSQVR